MEPFEDEGVFWRPGKEDVQQAGRLKFDAAEGATLDLIGGFGDLQEQFSDQARMIRIHGVAGKRYLTLDRCFNTNTTFEMPGISRQNFYVNRIITGHLFEEGEELTFDRCSVAFDQLPAWVRRSGVSISLQTQTPELSQAPDKITIEFEPLQDEVTQVEDEELRLAFTWHLGGDNVTETYLNQDVHFELKYPTARPLESILDDVKYLQDFLTLATAAPAVPEEITLWREDIAYDTPIGEHRLQPMIYYAGQLAERVRLNAPQSSGKVLFQLSDIGGLSTIGQWVRVAREYRAVLGSLLSIRYSAGLYVENRFNNVISAAESFHRLRFPNYVMQEDEFKTFRRSLIRAVPKEHRNWLGQQLQYSNEPRLRHRLTEMVSYCGEAFAALYPDDSSTWVVVVTESRNRLTHLDKERTIDFQPGDLYFLTESVFVLVMLCMFRECGVGDGALAAISENGTIQFLRGKLAEIVPRLHTQVAKHDG
jgi:hypothetical protein